MKRKSICWVVMVLVVSLMCTSFNNVYAVQNTAQPPTVTIGPTNEEPESVEKLLRFNVTNEGSEEIPLEEQDEQANSYSMLVVLWILIIIVLGSGGVWLFWRKRKSKR